MQMARFAREYWQHPVAVNDLGAVAFYSKHYVLDYAGLALLPALISRTHPEKDRLWMDHLAKNYGVGLAMIYKTSFPDIPAHWHKLGELHLDVLKVTPASSTVDFYATTPEAASELRPKVADFATTLPHGASFKLFP